MGYSSKTLFPVWVVFIERYMEIKITFSIQMVIFDNYETTE